MRKLLYLLIFVATMASAQTAITGTCSVNWPAGITFDGTTFKVPKLSTAELTLTGGTPYADGQYLVSIKSGLLTYVPYTAPTGGASLPGKSYPLAVPQQAGWAVGWFLVPNAVVTPGQTYSTSPVITGVPSPATWNYITWATFVNSSGQVYLRIGNGTGNAFPASSWTVTIK